MGNGISDIVDNEFPGQQQQQQQQPPHAHQQYHPGLQGAPTVPSPTMHQLQQQHHPQQQGTAAGDSAGAFCTSYSRQ